MCQCKARTEDDCLCLICDSCEGRFEEHWESSLTCEDCLAIEANEDLFEVVYGSDSIANATLLDAIILSHAHIDHSGNLPGLVGAGFDGSIYCTRATADITTLMLRDSAKIQREDAAYRAKKAKSGDPPAVPLYSEDDARHVATLFEYVPVGEWQELGDDVRLRLHHAGHILGSAVVELELLDDGEWKRVVFTGDLGRRDKPLLFDPTPVERCDVVITESTYGDRVHPTAADVKSELQRVICDAREKGGRVIIPAFSLGRTQLLVYLLNEL